MGDIKVTRSKMLICEDETNKSKESLVQSILIKPTVMTKRGEKESSNAIYVIFKDHKGVNEPSAPYKELMMLCWVITVNSLGGAPLLFGVVINPVSHSRAPWVSTMYNLAFTSIWMRRQTVWTNRWRRRRNIWVWLKPCLRKVVCGLSSSSPSGCGCWTG